MKRILIVIGFLFLLALLIPDTKYALVILEYSPTGTGGNNEVMTSIDGFTKSTCEKALVELANYPDKHGICLRK